MWRSSTLFFRMLSETNSVLICLMNVTADLFSPWSPSTLTCFHAHCAGDSAQKDRLWSVTQALQLSAFCRWVSRCPLWGLYTTTWAINKQIQSLMYLLRYAEFMHSNVEKYCLCFWRNWKLNFKSKNQIIKILWFMLSNNQYCSFYHL